jgi:hypothetical protein
MRAFVLAVLVFLSGCFGFGQTLVFPHFANGTVEDGSVWSTEIDLVNTTSSDQSATVTFFNQDATRRTVSLPGFEDPETGRADYSDITLLLAPNSMRVLETAGFGETQRPGWVRVIGTEGIKGSLIFRLRDAAGNIVAQAGVLPSAPSASIDFIPLVPLTNVDFSFPGQVSRATGFAMANPGADEASGEIQLVSDQGELVATSSFTLGPCWQMAQFVSERFDSLDLLGHYYLRVRVDAGAVSVVALSTAGSLISSIPAN